MEVMNENNQLAIKWCMAKLAENNFPNSIWITDYEKIENPKVFLETQLERLMFGCALERKMSYKRVKQLKDKLTNNGN